MVQDTGNRLIEAFQKQTEKIRYFCSAQNISPNLSVHEIRKSFKRIRALWSFYSEIEQDYENTKIELKAAGKILSPIRESFVNIQIFEQITSGDNHIPERKIKQTGEILFEKNKALIENGYGKNDLCKEILLHVEKFERKVDLHENDNPSLSQIKNYLLTGFTESYEIFLQLEPEFAPTEMHELRKNLKGLWYQTDFIKFKHPRYFRLKSDQLNKITEQLGDDHDWYVFGEELKLENFDLLAEELTILQNQIDHLRELNRVKLLPRLKQFFNEPPVIFSRKLDKVFRTQ